MPEIITQESKFDLQSKPQIITMSSRAFLRCVDGASVEAVRTGGKFNRSVDVWVQEPLLWLEKQLKDTADHPSKNPLTQLS